jgi:glycosyltransferase involved in cell wall biosynthesis
MRITIVLGPFLPIPPVLGGAVEKVHLQLAGAYQAAGHDVTIISRKYKDFPDEETVGGIRHIRIASFDRSSSLAVNLALDFRYAWRVARALPPSDITITNSFFLPIVLRRRTAGKIYVHVARFPKHQMRLYARSDRLQAISHAVADEIVRQAPSLSRKVATIGYPIPDSYFSTTPVSPRKKVVLFVGRIAREKGVHLLIDAFRAMRKDLKPIEAADWKLRIVGPHEVTQGGDGAEYLGDLARRAQPLGDACEFVGPVFDEQALIREYRAASIFVYPSLAETGEAFGLAPLEAMASGCAVIVSGLRCFDDFIENGKNGLKFDHRSPDTPSNLSALLTDLIVKPGKIEGIASNGNVTARKFETSAIAGLMLSDFRSLVADSGVVPHT